jgi:DNA-binding NtrC family response regulator
MRAHNCPKSCRRLPSELSNGHAIPDSVTVAVIPKVMEDTSTAGAAVATMGGSTMTAGTSTYEVTAEASTQRVDAQLILIYNYAAPLEPSTRVLLQDFCEVTIGRGDSRQLVPEGKGRRRRLKIELRDSRVSSQHARLVRDGEDWLVEDAGSRNGTELGGRRLEKAQHLTDGAIVLVRPYFFLFRVGAVADDRELVEDDDLACPTRELATFNGALGSQLAMLERAARSDKPILVLGETGTGKEVISRAVHALSGRSGRFVPTHLAPYSDDMLLSELFGHRKGAFTGATEDSRGLVRSADGGTLFLDELGDLKPATQTALLRVLQSKEVQPYGASGAAIPVNVRFVAATNQNLSELIAAGRFRPDLYARVATDLVVRLPRLADRREDLGLLTRAFVRRLAPQQQALSFTSRVGAALIEHDWPYNVRELENAIGHALVQSKGGPIDIEHLPEAFHKLAPSVRDEGSVIRSVQGHSLPAAISYATDRKALEALLTAHHGNVTDAATAIGKQPKQLYRWFEKHGIDPEDFRS